jgi:hypothetical protein
VTADSVHRDLLAAFPELGPHFGMRDVLGNFSQVVREYHEAGDRDVVRRSFEYVEWLCGAAPELAELAVASMFGNVTWGADVEGWIGPRTRSRLAP